jgi:hypothetical protein
MEGRGGELHSSGLSGNVPDEDTSLLERQAKEVWRCELVSQSFTSWEFLCRKHAIAKRAERQRGQEVWMKVLPRSLVDHHCAPCESAKQSADDTAWMRYRRASVWSGSRDLHEPRRKPTKEKWR